MSWNPGHSLGCGREEECWLAGSGISGGGRSCKDTGLQVMENLKTRFSCCSKKKLPLLRCRSSSEVTSAEKKMLT